MIRKDLISYLMMVLFLSIFIFIPFFDISYSAELKKVMMTQPVDTLSFLTVYAARNNGYFTDEGIDLQVTVTGGGGPDVHALIAKNVDFCATATDLLITSTQEGKPLLGVQNILGKCIVNLVIRSDIARAKNITPQMPLGEKLKHLKGTTIGVSRPGSLTYQVAVYFLKKAGLTPSKDADIIAVGGGMPSIAALEQKKIDVLSYSTPVPEQAVSKGIAVMFVNNAMGEDPDLADYLQQVLLIRPDYTNEDLIRKMVKALNRANKWVYDNSPDNIMKAVRKDFSQLEPAVLVESIKNVKAGVVPDGVMTEKGVIAAQNLLDIAGLLKKRIPWDTMVTNKYLPR